jgi:Na+/proline symporter
MLIGGFFLYASYYGADQSQVQRELTVGTVDDVRKSLMVNALGRFPLVLLYCIMGVLVGAVIALPESHLQIAAAMQIDASSVTQTLQNDPDRMVPMFILSFLPHGIIGFIFVAIMAALMSSLDSGINSLSAVTMKDFYQRYIKKEASETHYLWVSKLITFLWGTFCVCVAILLSASGEAARQTTIVLINAVGSLLYGPILAAFLMGMLTKRLDAAAIKIGIISGIVLNIILWLSTPISWMWWNLTGFLMSVLTAFLYSLIVDKVTISFKLDYSVTADIESSRVNWLLIYKFVVLYFFFLLAFAYLIE